MRRYLWCMGVLAGAGVFGLVAATINRAVGEDGAKPAPDKPAAAASGESNGDLTVGEPIRYANLTVFPLSSRTPKTENRFTTLDEGLKAGTVTVMEIGAQGSTEAASAAAVNAPPQAVHANQPTDHRAANPAPTGNPAPAQPAAPRQIVAQQEVTLPQFVESDGADVNHLALVNHSGKPLYLMPGEIIVGGQQDRTIAQEYVIAPGKKPTTIEVFCVEHGRWVGRGTSELNNIVTANAGLALSGSNSFSRDVAGGGISQSAAGGQTRIGGQAANLGPKADPGKFIGSVGNVNKAARIAVQADKSQQKVWDKVAEINSKNRNTVESGDFAGNYLDKQSVGRLEPYFKAMNQKVADSTNVVGVAIAIDGKMDTLDLFESTPLFRKLWPKLLKSYALDAVNAAEETAEAKVDPKAAKKPAIVCGVDDARKFLAEAMSARAKKSTTTNGDVAVTTLSTDHILTFCAGCAAKEGFPECRGNEHGWIRRRDPRVRRFKVERARIRQRF